MLTAVGYRMAKNLRTKIPETDMMVVIDVNKAASEKFVKELSQFNIVVAESAREVAEKSVSIPCLHNIPILLQMMICLSYQ